MQVVYTTLTLAGHRASIAGRSSVARFTRMRAARPDETRLCLHSGPGGLTPAARTAVVARAQRWQQWEQAQGGRQEIYGAKEASKDRRQRTDGWSFTQKTPGLYTCRALTRSSY